MEKEFIPYAEALALKELGFDEPCCQAYHTNGENELSAFYSNPDVVDEWIKKLPLIKAPLYQQAFRWFREKYQLWSMVYPRDGWNYAIQRIDETTSCTEESFHGVEINLYEEAEQECLIKLIEITKEKK